ncbi:cilia- and flagella-associated protein 44 [Megalops cyprinoides]|uniref:cilia- and flagella-associated protein 44 n=1 Tax=Megalops cyprinoides TaxID=118141 RepID=UPI001863E7D2|nr:cilia- and flagella-associated protein 44 [Megalops cyprinoides]
MLRAGGVVAGQLTQTNMDPSEKQAEETASNEEEKERQASGAETPPTGEEVDADTAETEEGEDSTVRVIPQDMYYDYEELYSRAFISPDSSIPANLLQLTHSFGYDCARRCNLQLLDEQTLAFVAGNLLVLLDLQSREQRYLRSCSGGGIGTIMAHPSKEYFAVAEKGHHPNIIIYEFPSLRPYRLLRGGTVEAYSCVDFNREGALLASVGSAPDYMLTLWEWAQERVLLRCKAFSQDVFRVTFSPYNPGQLTTSGSGHVKFWKMANTFTGLKLQGQLGRFGKTALTDIEGYVELPDGKVVSGSEWGNMLLWEGGLIKVEICRERGKPCHSGSIQQFALDEGELITIGTDGAIRGWDVEKIDAADCADDSGMFVMEPMNEMLLGRHVRLTSMVKSSVPESLIWFAQDSNGCIWKLDLSFSNITHDPECLFSFHAGAIQAMDVSPTSYLMATTALDRTVRIYDFSAKRELTVSQYIQGGTALSWAPCSVSTQGAVLAVGFSDGVLRLLELYRSLGLEEEVGLTPSREAELRLKQALKPHNAPVTAIAFKHSGELLATGSADGTVFFFTVGETCAPIGFIRVPAPVQCLQWAPKEHDRNTLLIVCESSYVLEVQAPAAESHTPTSTYEMQGFPTLTFHFHSIKARIQREMEIARREALKEKRRKEKEEREKQKADATQEEEEEKKEEEEELPPLHTPDSPSPMLCAFYSQPGAFWLSMGGYDAGFLYHCRFSEQQEGDPALRRDEPFAFLPVQDTEDDPICTLSFSSDRQLLLCGMQTGCVRVFPLQPPDPPLSSLTAFWALSVHDNQYGRVRSVRCSHDDRFVLSAGDDGNIFAFSLQPSEPPAGALQHSQTRIPSPPADIDLEQVVQDIVDPNAYSIETAKQRTELDRLRREAEQRKEERRRRLLELQAQFKQLLQRNQSLPEHVRLPPEELELDPRFREEAERLTALRIREVQKELAWEAERHQIGLKKLQDRFWESLESDIITVVACQSEHRVSTYRLLPPSHRFLKLQGQCQTQRAGQDPRPCRAGSGKGSATGEPDSAPSAGEREPGGQREEEQDDLGVLQGRGMRGRVAGHQGERQQKAAEKAEQVKAKIERRKQEWADLFASKPDQDYEDPADVLALQQAIEHMGDFKLKTAKDFTVPEQLRMNTERKRSQLLVLEEEICERKQQLNGRIVRLREEKLQLIWRLQRWAQQLDAVQTQLPAQKRLQTLPLPVLRPEEAPERRLQYTPATLRRFAELREARARGRGLEEGEEAPSVLHLLQHGDDPAHPTPTAPRGHAPHPPHHRELTELEEEMRTLQEIRLCCQQEELLSQMREAVWRFDAELQVLRHEKVCLDMRMKMADLRHVTLFQELLLLKDFEKRENNLQERLRARTQEENDTRLKWEDCKKQLELKQQGVVKLQQREKALSASFHASLGDNNKFSDFLTRVFKKKVKRVKKKETSGDEEEQEDSEEDSDEECDWDEEESEGESESGGALDDSVCPPSCDPALFENTLQLRERRLDLEELLAEEKKSCDALRKECDALAKKEKVVQASLKAAEGDLELFDREKQQKLNELDVIVPLRLHQIEFLSNGVLPSDVSDALVMNTAALKALQARIRQLQIEKQEQGDAYRQARQRHALLTHEHRDMQARIHELEERCEEMMLAKFGRLVDLEVLQTLSGNSQLEELKQDCRAKEAANTQELKRWKVKLTETKRILMEVSRRHTERVCMLNSLLKEKKELEEKLESRQRKMGAQFRERRVEVEERSRLQAVVEVQGREMEALRQEITALSRKGGHVAPPSQPRSAGRRKPKREGGAQPALSAASQE